MKRIVCGGRCVDVQQFILMMTNAISRAAPFSRLKIVKNERTLSHNDDFFLIPEKMPRRI